MVKAAHGVTLIRHLIAIAALPFTVAVFIPLWLARRYAIIYSPPMHLQDVLFQVSGAILFVVGLLLFAASLYHFATQGRGTLAPWDPPERLVLRGPYRYVRNPMISGVIFVLFSEALALESWPHAGWAAIFFAINLIYIPLVEEPQLVARFGAPYEDYLKRVPRFIPNPWKRYR